MGTGLWLEFPPRRGRDWATVLARWTLGFVVTVWGRGGHQNMPHKGQLQKAALCHSAVVHAPKLLKPAV